MQTFVNSPTYALFKAEHLRMGLRNYGPFDVMKFLALSYNLVVFPIWWRHVLTSVFVCFLCFLLSPYLLTFSLFFWSFLDFCLSEIQTHIHSWKCVVTQTRIHVKKSVIPQKAVVVVALFRDGVQRKQNQICIWEVSIVLLLCCCCVVVEWWRKRVFTHEPRKKINIFLQQLVAQNKRGIKSFQNKSTKY